MSRLFDNVVAKIEKQFMDDFPWFSIPWTDKLSYKHKREFNTVIEGYETVIEAFFDEKGKMVGARYKNRYIPSEEEEKLNRVLLSLKEALNKEDYIEANRLKKERDDLIEKMKTK